MKEGYVLFFDSGVGGLTLLRECAARFPQERFAYIGDNANAPYGEKGEGEICALVAAALTEARRLPVRALVLACNTVTALCAPWLRGCLSFPVFGVEPALRPAALFCRGGRVLVLATRRTAESARFRGLLEKNSSLASFDVFVPARLAAAVEENFSDLSRIPLEEHLPHGKYDAVVLGCTHYIFLRDRIRAFFGTPVFDGNSGTADHIASTLNICSQNSQNFGKKTPIFLGNGAKINFSAYKCLI